jgi:gas vesicle protein
MAGFFDRFKKKVDDIEEDAEDFKVETKEKAEDISDHTKEKAGNLSEDWDKIREDLQENNVDR